MKFPHKIFLVFLFAIISFAFSSRAASPITADVEELCGRNYYDAVHSALQNARKSVTVVMYFVSFDPGKSDHVSRLVNDLLDARSRGIRVKAIVDRNINYDRQGSAEEISSIDDKNKRFFDYLKEAGIEVYYDNAAGLTHGKAIVIDDETVIVGSTNWSEMSLSRNNEFNVLIRSPELAKQFIDYSNTIAIDREESAKEPLKYKKLSKTVLTGPLADFVRTNNNTCWNLLMLLIERNRPGSKIDFDHSIAEADLKISEDRDRFRERINENLKLLADKYGLIDVKLAYGKNAEVVIKPAIAEGEECFEIPNTFWKYGWNKRLSLPAQYCLFINFLKSGPNHQKWFQSKKLLSDEFKVSHSAITDGMLELKRWNLIQTEWGSIEDGFSGRPANRYTLNNLYSIDDFNSELDKLKGRYGADNLGKALEFAKIVLDDYNLEHIEDIAVLINEFGLEKVAFAFDKVSKYKIHNPMRTLRYVAGIVRTEEK